MVRASLMEGTAKTVVVSHFLVPLCLIPIGLARSEVSFWRSEMRGLSKNSLFGDHYGITSF